MYWPRSGLHSVLVSKNGHPTRLNNACVNLCDYSVAEKGFELLI